MSELIKGLLESRAADWERAKSLLTTAETEKRELSADENTEFDKLMAAMSDKDAKAKSVSEAEERAVKVDAIRSKFEVAAVVAEAKGDDDGHPRRCTRRAPLRRLRHPSDDQELQHGQNDLRGLCCSVPHGCRTCVRIRTQAPHEPGRGHCDSTNHSKPSR